MVQTQLQGKKKFKTLDKPYKEILYSFAGFGPNLLMVIMGAYFQNAVNPSALGQDARALQSIGGICLILPALFSVLWFIAKCFDGIIDIPFANVTDSLRTKWGNRRIPIAICFIPMVVSYGLCWYPICGYQLNSVGNTVWIFAWALLFFATYTMSLIAYYGSLSTVCIDEKQKTRVSSYKSFFDTISYALVYALVPIILKSANIKIDTFVYLCMPIMLTMIIPLFMIKEGEKWEAKAIAAGYDITPLNKEKPVKLFESIKLTCKNKPFIKWVCVNACAFFALQLFLVSMNALETGAMELNTTQITIANTCAFAPVPIMLYLFNKMKANNGVRFAFQTSLICFAIAILGFFFGSKFFIPNNSNMRMIVACVAGLVGSFGIGAFFMMGYLIPAQISSVEEILTKKNHSAMYFATQAVTTSIVGAISSSLIWENIKGLFFSTKASGVVKASSYDEAQKLFNLSSTTNVYNLGTFIVPLFVCVFCIVGFIIAFMMPKSYTHEYIGVQIVGKSKYKQMQNKLPKSFVYPFEQGSIIVFNALWLLSGTIFSYIWYYSLINSVNSFANKKTSKWWIILSIVFPFWGIYICYRLNKQAYMKCKEMNIETRKYNACIIIFGLLLLSCVGASIVQHKLNSIALIQNAQLRKARGK